jgi:hypothetical protein
VRVFVPLTPADLEEFASAGSWGAAEVLVHADTPALLAELPDADDEEREFAATTAAADAALRLLAAAGGPDPWRRVVLAVDLDLDAPARPAPDHGPSAVVLPGPLRWADAASILADDPAAGPDVREAAAADDPALADGHALLWFALQERDALRP